MLKTRRKTVLEAVFNSYEKEWCRRKRKASMDTRKTFRTTIQKHFGGVVTCFIYLFVSPVFCATVGSFGTDFWLTFPKGHSGSSIQQLLISCNINTGGTVQIPGIGYSTNYTVPAGATTAISLPFGTMPTVSDGVTQLGIHVVALDPVGVTGLGFEMMATDGYLGMPTTALGTNYIVHSYSNATTLYSSEFAIVGPLDGTSVTITPSSTVGSRTAGVPYVINLNQGDVYQLQYNAVGGDLSGTLVSSNLPIAVFGSVSCVQVPVTAASCNYIVEQLWPTTMWGTNYLTVPLATRLGGDTFRFLASQDGSSVSVNGVVVANLNLGQFYEQIISTPSQITSNYPIQVMQYSNGQVYDLNGTSDPTMISIPPADGFGSDYLVSMPITVFSYLTSGFISNFENIVVPTSGVGSITLDGVPIPAAGFSPIGTSGFSGAAVSVSVATHHLTGSVPFGVIAYGFNPADAYGYPGGFLLTMKTPIPTFTPTDTPSSMPSHTDTPTETPSVTPSATLTTTATVTWTPSTSATWTETITPTPTETPAGSLHLWPNPYNPSEAVRGKLKCADMPGGSSFNLYTISGELVFQAAEIGHRVEWNGMTQGGKATAPGFYYYVVQLNKRILLKGVLVIQTDP